MLKIISNKPWLLVGAGFLAFVFVWVSFIIFAVKNRPREVTRVSAPTAHAAH